LFAGYLSDLSSIPPVRYRKEAAVVAKTKVQTAAVAKLSSDVTEQEVKKMDANFQADTDKVQAILVSTVDGWQPVKVAEL